MDKVAAAADAMADEAAEDDGEEDEVHLRRRRKTETYPRSVDRLPQYSEGEQHQCTPQTLSNDTIIGIIVSRVDSTWRMDTHPQLAHVIGENLDTKKDAPDRIYSSTLQPVMLHHSRDNTRISCLRGSDR